MSAHSQTFSNRAFCKITQRDQLQCLEVRNPFFHADILLQGAQLIHYRPASANDSWIWLSDQAEYLSGKSLRGGIPVCWPWFGNADKNPQSVQQHIPSPETAAAHGFARNEIWQIENIKESCHEVQVCLSFMAENRKDWQGTAKVKATFIFRKNTFELTLSTENMGSNPLHLSQALHSYFPTEDIQQSRVYGLETAMYADALINDNGEWKRRQQDSAVSFTQETDRVYFPKTDLAKAATLRLQTPQQQLRINSENSASCVVWNPWIEKSRRLSQFDHQAYQQMLCIETANVLEDAVILKPGEIFGLKVSFTQI